MTVLFIGEARSGKTSLILSALGYYSSDNCVQRTKCYEFYTLTQEMPDGKTRGIELIDVYSLKSLMMQDNFYIHMSDLVVLVLDGTDPDVLKKAYEHVRSLTFIKRNVKVRLVIVKCDEGNFIDMNGMDKDLEAITCSNKLGIGISELRKQILSDSHPTAEKLSTIFRNSREQKVTQESKWRRLVRRISSRSL